MESGELICPAAADQGRPLYSKGKARRHPAMQWQREASSAANSNAGHRAATAVNRMAETGAAEALIGSVMTAEQGNGIEVRGMNS